MAFKKPTSAAPVPESPDRLFRDLPRRKHASLFDHQGQVLRTYAANAVDAPDVALQLPTGSGKTLVGLLIAEWRRRKFGEKIIYLCPTRQLVNQVAEEANTKYGLTVEAFTGSAKGYAPEAKTAYNDGDRVAVATYSSLFNTNPFFINPDVIIVDDAHASENYIASQWTLRISSIDSYDAALFAAVAGVLKQVLSPENFARLVGDWESFADATWVDKIPTAQLAAIAEELRSAIYANLGDSKQKYAWRMLADNLTACQLYVSSREILLRPLIPPTWTHPPFANAGQRIFMSATLGEGGDLERLTGRKQILRLPIPDGWDRQGIGRRLFYFPEKSLDESETLELRRALMKRAGRSLVLTPSNESAFEAASDVQAHVGFPTILADELEATKTTFTGEDNAVAIVANRYDGIDFPDDDCRLLFVEGLPRAVNLQERFLMSRMGANLLFNERIQTRIMQAIGRCTRGLNDYSAVVVTGQDLPEYLTDKRRRRHFHPELQAELHFGILQSTEVTTRDFLENFDIFLENDEAWEEANEVILDARGSATQEPFPAMGELSAAVEHEIAYQTAMWEKDYTAAYESAREVLGVITGSDLRGYRALWHYLAGSAAHLAAADGDAAMRTAALQQFRSARSAATGIPWLVKLAHGQSESDSEAEGKNTTIMLQVERLEARLAKLGTVSNRKFSSKEAEIRKGLSSASGFEQAQVELGEHFGFVAGKRESDASPDPWWMIGDIVIVFEDHANAKGDMSVIDATKARQAASHPDWVKEHVPGASDARIYPALVTPATKAKSGAIPSLGRVYHWDLAEFRAWSEEGLNVIRELRRTFVEPGDLDWRAKAAEALEGAMLDAPGIAAFLKARVARDKLKEVP